MKGCYNALSVIFILCLCFQISEEIKSNSHKMKISKTSMKTSQPSQPITIRQDVYDAFYSLKIERALKVLIFRIANDNGNILEIVHKVSGSDVTFKNEDIFEYLPSNEPRFIVYDFSYETLEKPPRKANKLLLIFWSPVTAPFRFKILYSSVQQQIKASFTGIQKEIQAVYHSDLDYEVIRKFFA